MFCAYNCKMCHGMYSIQLAGGASETAEEREIRSPTAVYPQLGRSRSPRIISWARKNYANGSGGRTAKHALTRMLGICGERERTISSARAILAYLQPAPWNREDWKEVYTASVRHRRAQRMPSNRERVLSLARSRIIFRSAYILSHAVLEYALNFTSTRHLDATCECAKPPTEFVYTGY